MLITDAVYQHNKTVICLLTRLMRITAHSLVVEDLYRPFTVSRMDCRSAGDGAWVSSLLPHPCLIQHSDTKSTSLSMRLTKSYLTDHATYTFSSSRVDCVKVGKAPEHVIGQAIQ
jgi:hypothetical protein